MPTQLTPSAVLDVWEAGREADPLTRAATMWRAATARGADEPVTVPIGQRDRELLHTRIATFGPMASSFVACPRCDEELEFDLDLRSLAGDEAPQDPIEPLVFDRDGWRVEYRLPVPDDVGATAARGLRPTDLLTRCIVAARHDGAEVPPAAAAAALFDDLDAEMELADPLAGIMLRLECVSCPHEWRVRFDIAHYLWREVEIEAVRVLGEVHRLAHAYAWSEAQILALSPSRRRAYLAFVSGSTP